jgi:hypothetical protein
MEHIRSDFRCVILLLMLILSSINLQVNAQGREQYTGSNVILIGLESAKGLLEYRSDRLQVRYNKENSKIECRLPVSSIYPLSDTIPPEMAYQVFFGSKYHEVIFFIDAPADIINSPRINTEPQMRTAYIELQGTMNEKKVPVVFASDRGVINLSTNFDIVLGNFNASIPAAYIPFLNGRIQVAIRNARWLNSTMK